MAMTMAITVASTGMIESIVLTLPRLVPSVISVIQALKAASFAVEPAKVMMQSKTTRSAITMPLFPESKSTGITAKSIIVKPQTI